MTRKQLEEMSRRQGASNTNLFRSKAMYEFYVFFSDGAYLTVSGPSLAFVGERFPTANVVSKSDLSERLVRFEP